ncbi:MAG TPA: glycosyltransferase family 39 protein [Chitinophagales bacterium]|nr:glycosyltransferase family 39 protein [Chitinophagales bacterium]
MKSKGKYVDWLIYLALLAAVYVTLLQPSYFTSRPHGDHAWAQCDRASVALNYYQFNYPFTDPHTHNIVYNPSGIATGECPIIPFTVSKLYSLLGFHEYIFRLFTLLLSIPGFILSFYIAKRFIKARALQIATSVTWVCSPNLIYYSTGFLPDNAALTFFIAGFYFLTKTETPSFKNILLFSLLSTVGVLLKSSVLFLVAAVYVALLITASAKGELKVTFKKAAVVALPLLACIGWIVFAKNSQQMHNSNVFKLGVVLPQNFNSVLQAVISLVRNLPKFYPLTTLVGLALVALIYTRKFKADNFLQVFNLTGFGLWFIFFVLMMRNAPHHGYYHVPFQFLVFTFLISVCVIVERDNFQFSANAIRGLMATGIVSLVIHNFTLHNIASHSDFINEDWNTLEPILRQAGIKNTDKVFTAYDQSYNISLYLMNQRGWNCMEGVWDYYKTDGLKPCDYAVLTDSNFIQQDIVKPYFGEKIATHGSLLVYRLKH